MIRLLVVDDSAFVRYAIARMVATDPEIEVAGVARSGVEAIAKTKELHPDVLTLDVEMPEMDGLTALRHIMAEAPTPVVMVSSLTSEGAQATIRALELGAVDFFLKSTSSNPLGSGNSPGELISKIRIAAALGKTGLGRLQLPYRASARHKGAKPASGGSPRRLVVIASSTGGPRTLHQVVPALPAGLPAAVLIVQHMPAGFTKTLAERLDELSEINVREAAPGVPLAEGTAFLAPGGYHMVVDAHGVVDLNRDPAVLGLRPAADVTMLSVAPFFGRMTVAAVLTGMGSDGTKGCAAIKAAGGRVLAQDEATSVVYGMPRSVVEAGLADKVVPLPDVAGEIAALCALEER
ncbi:MAG: chemotaxis response regulator protein-glutamate methylesterase [Candidatus Methylomirabilales bacterium]